MQWENNRKSYTKQTKVSKSDATYYTTYRIIYFYLQ